MRGGPNVLHLPHASREIPPDLRPSLLLDDAALERELDRLTDHATDRLFGADPSLLHVVRSPVSRLVLDPERFEDDAQEPAAAYGMGVIYTRTGDGRTLRATPTPEEREALLERFYRPHHERLRTAVDAALEERGYCLIIDAHSFPPQPLPYEAPSDRARPGICLGTDPFHTPDWLVALARDSFARAESWTIDVDHPFSGSIVPAAHYRRDERVHSLMVEVCRDLYWDVGSGRPNDTFVRAQLGLRKALALVRGRMALRYMA